MMARAMATVSRTLLASISAELPRRTDATKSAPSRSKIWRASTIAVSGSTSSAFISTPPFAAAGPFACQPFVNEYRAGRGVANRKLA